MNTSRVRASKAALARIQAMSTEELTVVLREKKSGIFAQAIREIAYFSDVEYDLNYRSQSHENLDMATDIEFCLTEENSWGFFEELTTYTTYEAANELLAA
ncbi:TPA: hypothetical protein RUZ79_000066 [Vibrio cholerae]|nr:hypothetical protein [Vibrio cholerae]HDZ9478736.1 hypothetical protein [Vibrio cholerae]